MNVRVTWLNEKHSVRLSVSHIGEYDDDAPGFTNESIDDDTVLDFQYSYTFGELLGAGATTVTFGVNNLTDEDPPAIDRRSVNGRIGFDQQVHDPRGRIMYLRLKHTF